MNIYAVRKGDVLRLVRAENGALALRFVANEYGVALATQDDLVSGLADGVVIEGETEGVKND